MEKISCPNCDFKFDIEGALAKDLQADYAKKISIETDRLNNVFKQKEDDFKKQQDEFEEKKKKENELFKQKLDKALIDKESTIKEKVQGEFNAKLAAQEKELVENSEKIKLLQTKEIELSKMQRKLKETEHEMEIKMQQRLLDEQQKIEEKITLRVNEQNELKLKEKDKQMDDLKKSIAEMKRKSEQGSMQLQGEIQELEIERILRSEFPYDQIEEVPKGARGADSIQLVNNEFQQFCGKIVYESKRTKNFSAEWISKLKADQRLVQADIGVLVTEVLPKDMSRFGMKDGIYICTFQEFKSLVFVLRQILIKAAEVRSTQENKGDKMEVLYKFLTGEEFKLQMTGIVDGFKTLKSDLDREKRSMQTIWKKREKQLESVISNTIDMYGSIKGIAGKAIPTVDYLELEEEGEHPDEDYE